MVGMDFWLRRNASGRHESHRAGDAGKNARLKQGRLSGRWRVGDDLVKTKFAASRRDRRTPGADCESAVTGIGHPGNAVVFTFLYDCGIQGRERNGLGPPLLPDRHSSHAAHLMTRRSNPRCEPRMDLNHRR